MNVLWYCIFTAAIRIYGSAIEKGAVAFVLKADEVGPMGAVDTVYDRGHYYLTYTDKQTVGK